MSKQYQVNNTSEYERVFVVGAELSGTRPLLTLHDSLKELSILANTAGMTVVGEATQNLHQIDPNTFIGSGKAVEIREAALEAQAQVIIFDDELSPRHQRELERLFGEDIRVIDRTVLILDIFAQHARTREGSLQVELAQYEYRLPRLTRQWTHLVRQAGGGAARGGAAGVGLRGPGETQLEVDRREIRRKIDKLKVDLERVRLHRQQHRQQRHRAGIPIVSLVGYTNAGKSTLLKALTGDDIYIADQLFATLDPLSRRVTLPSGRQVIMTDTVGFIQKLPTTLIAAFRATLEEVVSANLLIHVVDTAHSNAAQHIEAVEDTLAELDVPPIPRILAWNKMDLLSESPIRDAYDTYSAEVFVSDASGVGMDDLLAAIEDTLAASMRQVTLLIPYDRGDLLSMLFETATVESQEHTANGSRVTALVPGFLYERLKAHVISSK
ncbi:MAG: GTPase HflX [Anaerolineaceae bacterium]|nr:GTPase HflX [Anaerolineaceae bacterium]